MDLSKINEVSSCSGLYEINAQTRAGVLETSFIDRKRITTKDSAQISVLDKIKVHYLGEEILLIDL